MTQTDASGVCLVCQHAIMRRRVTKPVATLLATPVASQTQKIVRYDVQPLRNKSGHDDAQVIMRCCDYSTANARL